CPGADGFFLSARGNQCLKVYVDESRTWDAAKTLCETQGLELAKPQDAVGLRKYLQERYGDKQYWVGGKATGSAYEWIRDGQQLSSSDPLWADDEPDATASGNCLYLRSYASFVTSQPDQPYWDQPCYIQFYPVCEVVLH
ncbi:unnamed protein product, partial [Meganyctiphanes norvegica]